MPIHKPTACPILSRMREVAIANLRKRDRPALGADRSCQDEERGR